MTKKLFFLLIASALLVGCASSGKSFSRGLTPSYAVAEKEGPLTIVVEDLANTLAGLFPPGHTKVNVQKVGNEHLGERLENSLRSRGFTLVQLPDGNNIPADVLAISYVFDRLGETSRYSQLSLADNSGKVIVITRTWRLIDEETLLPEASTTTTKGGL